MAQQKIEAPDITDMGLKELVVLKEDMSSMIHDRQLVEEHTIVERAYRADTRLYFAQLKTILNAIDKIYDEMNQIEQNGFEYGENINERERSKLIIDEETGKPVVNKLATGLDVFDDHLLNGGIEYGSTFMLAGQSNAGKSEVVYMIMRSALQQLKKVHFHSYEIGRLSFFKNFAQDEDVAKNKFRLNLEDEQYRKLLSVDYLADNIESLEKMIRQRHADGCDIFVLDSLTKVTVNGKKATGNDESFELMDMLRRLAHGLGLIVIIIGQKDKYSKRENLNELFGGIMQEHVLDYILFIGYEDLDNIATEERQIIMTKNREDEIKDAVITVYDPIENKIVFKDKSNALSGGHAKAQAWANRLRK